MTSKSERRRRGANANLGTRDRSMDRFRAPASIAAAPARRDPRLAGRAWLLAIAAVSVLGVTACRQDMHNQPKYRGLRSSAFFADGSSARPLVEGTVARGTLQEDEAFFTGKVDKVTVKELPFAVDAAVLNRGQERYNIYCSPCHDKTGSGNGMV